MNGLLNPFILGSSGFVPPAGNLLWLKADAITGSSGGDPLETWPDSSGNLADAIKAGVVNPSYETNVVNGLPIVRFSSANGPDNGWMEGPLSLNLSARSTFIVYNQGAHVANAGLLIFSNAGSNDYDSNSALAYQVGQDTNEPTVEGGAGTGYRIENSAGSSGFRIISEVFGAGSGELWINGVSVGTDAHAGFALSNNGYFVGVRFLGGSANPSYVPNADISEILVFDSALSGGDRVLVENYLKSKYAIA